jgi:hypothetical protein
MDFKKCYGIIEQLKSCSDDERQAIYETMQDVQGSQKLQSPAPKAALPSGQLGFKQVGHLHGTVWTINEIKELTDLIKLGYSPSEAGKHMFSKHHGARSRGAYDSKASYIKTDLEKYSGR